MKKEIHLLLSKRKKTTSNYVEGERGRRRGRRRTSFRRTFYIMTSAEKTKKHIDIFHYCKIVHILMSFFCDNCYKNGLLDKKTEHG